MKSHSCPKCQATNTVYVTSSVFYICTHCKSGVDIAQNASVTAPVKSSNVSLSKILLGKQVRLQGALLTTIGRLEYRGSDDEDVWTWEEILLTDGTEQFWLEFEPEFPRFTLFKELSHPLDPAPKKVIDPRESGVLTSVEGELAWIPAPKEQVTYTTYQTEDKQLYSIEEDDGEKEYFLGTIIPAKEIATAFGLPTSKASSSSLKPSGQPWLAGALTAFFLAILAPLFERPVFQTTIPLCPANVTQDRSCIKPGDAIGPLAFKPRFHTYAIRLSSGLSTSSTNDFRLSFVEPSTSPKTKIETIYQPVHTTPTAFGVFQGETSFRLSHTGNYFLHLQAFPQTTTKENLTIQVVEKPLGVLYPWIMNVLFSSDYDG